MMVAAVVTPPLHHRRAAELAPPDDQRVFQQPALLQVRDQGGTRLIGDLAICLDVVRQVAVLIPRLMKDLHKPDPALQQPARQQARIGERRLARLGAVQIENMLGLVADVHHIGSA